MNSKSRSQALARCDIFAVAEDGSKTLCAAGQGTVSVIMLRD
ncbi:hypothetical protein O4214_01265 [Rhodococcus erythropolis]|nr:MULTISPECIES: hypothetical protein [Rhodococcus erythropolis group]MCZ4522593.1 hypothetical protein [Rhodococcus erythropolis]